jgi:hypothetical protein
MIIIVEYKATNLTVIVKSDAKVKKDSGNSKIMAN